MSYSDAFEVLKENRIIDEKLAERLKEMAKFRNFLVHRYAFVQKEKLVEIVKQDIKDIEDFVKVVLRLIKNSPGRIRTAVSGSRGFRYIPRP